MSNVSVNRGRSLENLDSDTHASASWLLLVSEMDRRTVLPSLVQPYSLSHRAFGKQLPFALLRQAEGQHRIAQPSTVRPIYGQMAPFQSEAGRNMMN